MAAIVNVNGHISGDREAVVPVLDHGFLFGEGVYETLRTYNERPFLPDRHLRLSECTQSNLFVVKNGQVSTPALDAGLLAGITREVVFELGRDEGVPDREAVLRDRGPV
jgi:branched-subunit amino acid aminotransferase/4-amino-4-deoxychorismate lyase